MLSISAYCCTPHRRYPSLPIESLHLKHVKAKEVNYFIQKNNMLSEKGSCAFDFRTNTLIIQDERHLIEKIKEFVEKVDKPIK